MYSLSPKGITIYICHSASLSTTPERRKGGGAITGNAARIDDTTKHNLGHVCDLMAGIGLSHGIIGMTAICPRFML